MNAILSVVCFFSLSLFTIQDASAGKSPRKGAGDAPECSGLLIRQDGKVEDYGSMYQVHSLTDLLQADPDKNLAVQHPLMMMNAYQKAWTIIRHFGSEKIVDPDYRWETQTQWKAFSEAPVKGVVIIRQENAINKVVTFIREGAAGSNRSKVISLTGPAGTGKTEVLKKLHLLRAYLGQTDSDFWEYGFRWVNLHKIPSLMPLQDRSQWEQPFLHQMGRSPIVLLPQSMQKRLIELTRQRVEKLSGYAPQPFTIPDPHTKEILARIIAHECPNGTPTEEQYINAVSPYVQLYRRVIDPDQPPIFVRNQGRDIEWSNLFMAEDPARKLVYGVSNPLTYDYSGLILQADGFGFFGDEFWRQIVTFRDSMLEVGQNRTVQRGGAPAVYLDAFMLLADNDESKQKALEESASNAQLDRGAAVPMRLALNPMSIAKTTLLMAMQEWGPAKFSMQDLTDKKAAREPLDIEKLFPKQLADGKLLGTDGRYALWYSSGSDREGDILIAPRSLLLLGLTAAASRLVTDPALLMHYRNEFDVLGSGSNEFFNPVTRLQIILGELPATDAIRMELTKVRALLEEGSTGISARSAQTWFLTALSMAEENHDTLTPALMDKAFKLLMDDKAFLNKNREVRAKWVLLNEQMKAGILLPSLTEDVLKLLSSRTDINALYLEMEKELISLFRDPEATQYEGKGANNLVDIDFKRLNDVKQVYSDLFDRSLEPGVVANFRLAHSQRPEDRHPGLLKAIQSWLYEKEISASALDQYLRYFQHAEGPDEVRRRAQRAREEMLFLGYNERALLEAMSMVRDLMREQADRRKEDQ